MTSFNYKPLAENDEIRILDVLPGSGPVSCRVRHARLSDRPRYEALSYCWGPLKGQQDILVDGQPFPARKNLHKILKHLRRAKHGRSLWIDAICINQQDNAEKAIQVPLMRQIYEQSLRTILWLGTPNVFTRRAFRVLRVMIEYTQEMAPARLLDCWRDAESNLDNLYANSHKKDKIEWNLKTNWFWDRIFDTFAFDIVWNSPWFTRVWIRQESTVCPDAILKCGDDEINWTSLARCYDWDEPFFPEEVAWPLINRRGWMDDTRMDLFLAYARNHSALATDPRDKVYGLLGLVRHDDSIQVDVDYDKDPAQVFLDFTTNILKTQPQLDVLAISRGLQKCSSPDLPSWCLHWEDISGNGRDWPSTVTGYARDTTDVEVIMATQDSKPQVEFTPDGKVLGLLGAKFDDIAVVGPPMPRGSYIWSGMPVFRAYLSWRQIYDVDSGTAYEPTGQPRKEVFWRMMKWFSLPLPINVAEENAKFEAFDNMVMRVTTLLPRYLFGVGIGLILLFIWDMFVCCVCYVRIVRDDDLSRGGLNGGCNRTMARTTRGYVILGPSDVQPGDGIFLVNGSRAPLVLRPYENRWRLVGDAYVPGIMGGEAFDSSKCEMVWIE